MKVLWVKTDFLHPTTRGGQIRTLEMLKQIHRRHEVHYVAFDDGSSSEGIDRSGEYCSFAYPIVHHPVAKNSPLFAAQLVGGLFSKFPVAASRYRSEAMRTSINRLLSEHHFDARVCDFLAPSINIDNLEPWTLFQHNVESMIWERHAATGRTPFHRAYFSLQAKKMYNWERDVCRSVNKVVTVSESDASVMEKSFDVCQVAWVPTGVDTQYFARPVHPSGKAFDLVFVGSMDWMPNIEGMGWFLREIWPCIRRMKPGCTLAIVGRNPPASLAAIASNCGAEVTGTVPDVRPYLWNSRLSIVPLQVGGGTRLKIFEAMAASTPVISTTIGAEGLPTTSGIDIAIADSPESFAQTCLTFLADDALRRQVSEKALQMVLRDFSWEHVTNRFEEAIGLPAAAASHDRQ